MERVIADIHTGNPGPTLICVGGVHGSEPAGVSAAARFADRLGARAASLRGRLLALRGNIPALEQGRRYIDCDLNRIWGLETDQSAPGGGASIEYREMAELAGLIHAACSEAAGPVCFLDLHTTSSETMPFLWLLPGVDRAFLERYGMPIVYDPVERVRGTLAQWIAAKEHRVVLAEGGRHDDPATVDCCEAMLWLTAVHEGCLAAADVRDEYDRARDTIDRACAGAHAFFNITYHHKITEEDRFRMEPGFRSFQPVMKGELLAKDRNGEIRAPDDGRILMPLYRPPCDDGFMLVREG